VYWAVAKVVVANAMSLGAIGGLTRACNTTLCTLVDRQAEALLTAMLFSLTFTAIF
jgi:hypothetical protein